VLLVEFHLKTQFALAKLLQSCRMQKVANHAVYPTFSKSLPWSC